MGGFSDKFSSAKQDWTTPHDLFDTLDDEFGFTCDLAADDSNALCSDWFGAEDDSLTQTWTGTCFLNPPYGDPKRPLRAWVEKAFHDTRADPELTVVALIPARTNTAWFRDHCVPAGEVRFIIGRPKFGDAGGNAAAHGLPQPLMLVVFDSKREPSMTVFDYTALGKRK